MHNILEFVCVALLNIINLFAYYQCMSVSGRLVMSPIICLYTHKVSPRHDDVYIENKVIVKTSTESLIINQASGLLSKILWCPSPSCRLAFELRQHLEPASHLLGHLHPPDPLVVGSLMSRLRFQLHLVTEHQQLPFLCRCCRKGIRPMVLSPRAAVPPFILPANMYASVSTSATP